MARSNRQMVRLTLFGGPVLHAGDAPVPLSPLQGALVGVLGEARSGGVSRDRLVHLLWDEEPGPRTRHRLSQLLYALSERTAPVDVVRATTDRVRLNPNTVRTDLDALRASGPAGLEPVAAAADTEFLSRLAEAPTRPYEDWLDRARVRLRSELRERAAGAWTKSSDEARWSDATRAAALLLKLDPLSEEALRRLMWARAMAGQVDEAVAAFAGFRERWDSAPGRGSWEPQPDTRTLLSRLKTLERTPQPPPEIGVLPGPPEPPFCGRHRELARLTRIVAAREAEGVTTVCVTGEGGMGKTRLVSEAFRDARLRGHLTLRGSTSRFEQDIPLNLLLDALDREQIGDALNGLDDPWRSVLLALLPQFHREDGPLPEVPTIKASNIPRRMYQAVHRLVESVAEDGPVLLFLDDFQWADETSVAALEFFRRRWSGGRLILVLGLRREHLGPRSRALVFAEEVLAEEETVHVSLDELDADAAHRLVEETSTRALDPDVRTRICSLGGRNPFFLVELTHEYLTGRLAPATPDRPSELAVPVSIRQVLERRFEELTEEDVHILEVLTVHDRPVPWPALPEIAERDGPVCVASVERLQALRLVCWDDRGLTIRHELIRHAVYGRLGRARRAYLHERVARGLLRSDGAEHPDELALHFDRAGIREEALRYSMEAADRAEASGGVPEALHFLTMARRNTDDPEAAAVIVGRLGHLNYLHRNLQDAAPLLDLAATRFREQGRLSRALTAEVERIDALSRMESLPPQDFIEELSRIKAEARQGGEWETLARALDVEAHALDRRGDVEGVRRVLGEVEKIADRGSAVARCAARTVLALKIFYGSRTQALAAARAAVEDAHNAGNDDQLLRACSRLIIVLLHQGLLGTQEGQETIALAHTLAKTSADRFLRFNQPLNQGVWHLDLGQYARAEHFFEQAKSVANEHPSDELDRNLLLNLAELRYHQHRIDESLQHFRTLEDRRFAGTPVYVPDIVQAGLGLCHLYCGRLNAAVKKRESLQPEPEWWSFDRFLIVLLRARLLNRTKDPQKAAEYLRVTSQDVEDRFVLSGIKMRLEEIRMRMKYSPESAMGVADQVIELCKSLGLAERENQIMKLRQSCMRRAGH